ncbi:hypothetical protein BU17DRAFT_102970 [Hysterangium stoloniferum]|nr:hypothetical protein BU17DRAFT_102970 [Hysterangium stoloniferum]
MLPNAIDDMFGAILSLIGTTSFLTTTGVFCTTTESKHLNKIITSTTTMKPLGFTKPLVVLSDITPINVPVSVDDTAASQTLRRPPAVDDGNSEGIDAADNAPAVDGGHVVGTDAADHALAVDDGKIKGTNAADRPPAVDDRSLGGTETDPDSTPCISWEDKGKGVNLREYGPLMPDGSLFTGSFAQRIGQGRHLINAI